ncbi:hypothetical protein ACFU6I_21925 [Streptomyces sp. NPDC057486]|uniref:hypothetical protein n=1 Tax=Streptomyces sp. NPDC057486 TaxID=3346145 RepID=UPI0036C06CB0
MALRQVVIQDWRKRLTHLLDLLVSTRFLQSWTLDLGTYDVAESSRLRIAPLKVGPFLPKRIKLTMPVDEGGKGKDVPSFGPFK